MQKDDFDHYILDNSQKHGRNSVCRSCLSRGYTVRNITTFKCVHGHLGGRNLFSKREVDRRCQGSKQEPLRVCLECERKAAEIQKKLKKKDAWRCTCKVRPFCKETCQLYPAFANEKRWEGKNVGTTEDDLAFLKIHKRQ